MPSFTKRKGALRASRMYTANFEIMAPARLCCTPMFGPGQNLLRAARWWLAAALVTVALLAPGFAALADDRTNLPLKNWGGFSLYRDAVYDDLERLVTAGFGDRAVLNSKPISRTAAARIVARAIDHIRRDDRGVYSDPRDLEALVDPLTAEVPVEL